MNTDISEILIGAIGEVIADEAPRFIGQALCRVAQTMEDPLSGTVLVLLAGFATVHDNVDRMAENIQAMLDGEAKALTRLTAQGATELDLLRLIEDWSHSTAAERERASRLAAEVSAVLRDRVSLTSRAAIAALTR